MSLTAVRNLGGTAWSCFCKCLKNSNDDDYGEKHTFQATTYCYLNGPNCSRMDQVKFVTDRR